VKKSAHTQAAEAIAKLAHVEAEDQHLRRRVEHAIAMLSDDPSAGPVVSEVLRNALTFKASQPQAVLRLVDA